MSVDSKIDLLDPPEVVNKKIKKATAAPKIVEENGVLALVEFVLLPAAALNGTREFIVERERDGLEPLVYTSVEKLHEDYRADIRKFHSLLFSRSFMLILLFSHTPTPEGGSVICSQ